MAIHHLGYREWDQSRTRHWLRPKYIALSGIALVWRRKWLRLMLMLAWLPIAVPAFGIFAFESSLNEPGFLRVVANLMAGPLQRPDIAFMVLADPESARHEVWTLLIMAFFRYPQLSAMILLVGLIAPMLISYDLRSRAYLLYFSRPLRIIDYILGKAAVVWFFLGMIVTVPALSLYVLGVLLSPNLSVVQETWDIPLRIIGASFVLLVPTTALAICYSACTSESRYASFAWFATWILGSVAYQVMTFSDVDFGPDRRPRPNLSQPVVAVTPSVEGGSVDLDRWRVLSPYHALGKVQAWVFGLDPTVGSVLPTLLLLSGITVFGFWIVRRRLISLLSV